MTVYPQLSFLVIGITALTLAWVAVTDLRQFKIRNEPGSGPGGTLFRLCARVRPMGHDALEFGLRGAGSCRPRLRLFPEQIGGGDMKLLAVAFLWTGPFWAAPFVVLMVVFIGVHYVAAKLKWVAVERSALGERIPLAPSVAAGLIATFALGGMAPLTG